MTVKALLMDFDGVIVESNEAKTEAFAELFVFYPGFEKEMMDYHVANISDSRMKKFEYYVYELFGCPGDRRAIEKMAETFSGLVAGRVKASIEVPGAKEFLEEFSARIPIYLSSATPEDELKEILEAKGLSSFFTGVFGFPPCPKSEAIRRVLAAEELLPREVVFVGDSLGDYNYARAAGLEFVGRNSGLPLDGVAQKYPDLFAIADWLRPQVKGDVA